MEENDFRGVWKTRTGRIVIVDIHGISAEHRDRVYMGYDKANNVLLYWDMEGKSLDNPDYDLMSRGTESYGEMKFK